MSVDKLLAALEKEAALKERNLLKEAEKDARKILGSARRRTEETRSRIDKLRKTIAARREAVSLARGRMDARRRALLALERNLGLVFDEVEKMWGQFMRSSEYAAFIEAEYKAVSSELGGVERVEADPVTAPALERLGAPNIHTAKNIGEGFVAHGANGASISCVFSLRLEKLWRAAGPGVVRRLMEEAPDAP